MVFGTNNDMDAVGMNQLIGEQAAEAARINQIDAFVEGEEFDFGNGL